MSKTGQLTKIDESHYLELKRRLIDDKHWRLRIKGKGKSKRMLIPPRPLEGIYEDTLVYDPHHDWEGEVGLLHTSWLPVEKKFRNVGTDSMWPLITEYGKAVWFGEPCKRTEEGIVDAYMYTLIIEHEIDQRPTCSLCNQMTHIKRIPGTKEYVHVCERNQYHPTKKVTIEFGFSLPPELKDFLKEKKQASDQYKKRNEREGIERKLAAMKRKKWILIDNEGGL